MSFSVQHSVLVRIEFDPAAQVYVAEAINLPGLVTEAATLDELRGHIVDLIPVMIEENGPPREMLAQQSHDVDGELWRLPIHPAVIDATQQSHIV